MDYSKRIVILVTFVISDEREVLNVVLTMPYYQRLRLFLNMNSVNIVWL